jgi:hypothetical protein
MREEAFTRRRAQREHSLSSRQTYDGRIISRLAPHKLWRRSKKKGSRRRETEEKRSDVIRFIGEKKQEKRGERGQQ